MACAPQCRVTEQVPEVPAKQRWDRRENHLGCFIRGTKFGLHNLIKPCEFRLGSSAPDSSEFHLTGVPCRDLQVLTSYLFIVARC